MKHRINFFWCLGLLIGLQTLVYPSIYHLEMRNITNKVIQQAKNGSQADLVQSLKLFEKEFRLIPNDNANVLYLDRIFMALCDKEENYDLILQFVNQYQSNFSFMTDILLRRAFGVASMNGNIKIVSFLVERIQREQNSEPDSPTLRVKDMLKNVDFFNSSDDETFFSQATRKKNDINTDVFTLMEQCINDVFRGIDSLEATGMQDSLTNVYHVLMALCKEYRFFLQSMVDIIQNKPMWLRPEIQQRISLFLEDFCNKNNIICQSNDIPNNIVTNSALRIQFGVDCKKGRFLDAKNGVTLIQEALNNNLLMQAAISDVVWYLNREHQAIYNKDVGTVLHRLYVENHFFRKQMKNIAHNKALLGEGMHNFLKGLLQQWDQDLKSAAKVDVSAKALSVNVKALTPSNGAKERTLNVQAAPFVPKGAIKKVEVPREQPKSNVISESCKISLKDIGVLQQSYRTNWSIDGALDPKYPALTWEFVRLNEGLNCAYHSIKNCIIMMQQISGNTSQIDTSLLINLQAYVNPILYDEIMFIYKSRLEEIRRRYKNSIHSRTINDSLKEQYQQLGISQNDGDVILPTQLQNFNKLLQQNAISYVSKEGKININNLSTDETIALRNYLLLKYPAMNDQISNIIVLDDQIIDIFLQPEVDLEVQEAMGSMYQNEWNRLKEFQQSINGMIGILWTEQGFQHWVSYVAVKDKAQVKLYYMNSIVTLNPLRIEKKLYPLLCQQQFQEES